MIGIDFDNTIVCYDDIFYQAAVQQKLIPEQMDRQKSAVRDFLRLNNREEEWTKLQGYVYGPGIDLAPAFAGVAGFFDLCQKRKLPASIISHKTPFPFLGPKYDLHEAAKNWLKKQNFDWTPPAFFEVSLENKLARIGTLQCDVFIDDLPELLAEKAFPPHVKKVLFDPHGKYPQNGDYIYAQSWDKIAEMITDGF